MNSKLQNELEQLVEQTEVMLCDGCGAKVYVGKSHICNQSLYTGDDDDNDVLRCLRCGQTWRVLPDDEKCGVCGGTEFLPYSLNLNK